MKNQEKKYWETPTIQVLDIKKDTFSGSKNGTENNDDHGANKPSGGVSPGATSTSTGRGRNTNR